MTKKFNYQDSHKILLTYTKIMFKKIQMIMSNINQKIN